MLQPLTLQANQSPLMVIADFRYSQGRRSSPLPEGTFEGRGEVTISLALANFHAIPFFLAESPTPPWDRHPASIGSRRVSRRQAQVCLRPLSSYGQDRASRPPPLQHRVPIRAASNSISRESSPASALSGSLRGFFSHRSSHLGNRRERPNLR